MLEFTLSDLEGWNKIDDKASYALVSHLKAVGLVKNAGKTRRKEGAKGKGETIYRGDPDKIKKHLETTRFGG